VNIAGNFLFSRTFGAVRTGLEPHLPASSSPRNPTVPDALSAFQPPSAHDGIGVVDPLPAVVGVCSGFGGSSVPQAKQFQSAFEALSNLHSRRHSKFYDRHLKPILCPTVFQRCQPRSIRRSIREIEPSDAEEVDPRTIAQISPDPGKCPVEVTSSIDHEAGIVPVLDDLDEIMDRQPPVTLPADDCDWPKSGCRL